MDKLDKQAKRLALFYGPALLEYDFGPQHPFGADRARFTYKLMEEVGLTTQPNVQVHAPVSSDRDLLYLFHHKDYVDFVQNACVRGYGFLDGGDTPAVAGGLEAAMTVVGTSCEAVDTIMRGEADYAFTIVGGLHHAFPGRASGFCIFNDLGVLIKKLRRDWNVQRIAYIDIDAHHGDGIMYSFYDDPHLLTVDFHEDGRYLFPGTGSQNEFGRGAAELTKFNIPMPPYSSDQTYIQVFDRLIPPLLRRFQPEFILLQSGVDAHGGDPITEMNYSAASYQHTVRSLQLLAGELCNNRLAIFGGGGYNVESCALRWTQVAAQLADYELPRVVPVSWREAYHQTFRQTAPTDFAETFTTDNTTARVMKTVEWLCEKTHI